MNFYFCRNLILEVLEFYFEKHFRYCKFKAHFLKTNLFLFLRKYIFEKGLFNVTDMIDIFSAVSSH